MRYIWQHIQTIVETYKGDTPLTHFLKNYFKQQPKLGSRDRKILSEMAYALYRCEKGLTDANPDLEARIKACLFLSGSSLKHIQSFIPEEWQAAANTSRAAVLQQHSI